MKFGRRHSGGLSARTFPPSRQWSPSLATSLLAVMLLLLLDQSGRVQAQGRYCQRTTDCSKCGASCLKGQCSGGDFCTGGEFCSGYGRSASCRQWASYSGGNGNRSSGGDNSGSLPVWAIICFAVGFFVVSIYTSIGHCMAQSNGVGSLDDQPLSKAVAYMFCWPIIFCCHRRPPNWMGKLRSLRENMKTKTCDSNIGGVCTLAASFLNCLKARMWFCAPKDHTSEGDKEKEGQGKNLDIEADSGHSHDVPQFQWTTDLALRKEAAAGDVHEDRGTHYDGDNHTESNGYNTETGDTMSGIHCSDKFTSGQALPTQTLQSPCVICADGQRSYAAVPCMHLAFCQTCVQELERDDSMSCPICKHSNITFSKVFF